MFTKANTLRKMFFAAAAALMLATVSSSCKKDDNKDPEPEAKPCFVRVTEAGIRDEMPDVLTVRVGRALYYDEYYCPSDGKKNLLLVDNNNEVEFKCLTSIDYESQTIKYASLEKENFSSPGYVFGFSPAPSAKEGDSEKFTLTYTSPDGKYTISKTVTVKVVK